MPIAVRWTEPGDDPTPTKDPSELVADWGVIGDADEGYVLEALLSDDMDVDDADDRTVEDLLSDGWCPVPDSIEVRFVPRAYVIPKLSLGDEDEA